NSLQVTATTGNITMGLTNASQGPVFYSDGNVTLTAAKAVTIAGTGYFGFAVKSKNNDVIVSGASIAVGQLVQALNGTANLTATTGSITDTNGASLNVQAKSLVASAATGVDADTKVTNITATTSG